MQKQIEQLGWPKWSAFPNADGNPLKCAGNSFSNSQGSSRFGGGGFGGLIEEKKLVWRGLISLDVINALRMFDNVVERWRVPVPSCWFSSEWNVPGKPSLASSRISPSSISSGCTSKTMSGEVRAWKICSSVYSSRLSEANKTGSFSVLLLVFPELEVVGVEEEPASFCWSVLPPLSWKFQKRILIILGQGIFSRNDGYEALEVVKKLL